MDSVVRVAVAQMTSTANVASNMDVAASLVRCAADDGAQLLVLPECFAYLGPESGKFEIAEPVTLGKPSGPMLVRCCTWAREHSIDLVLGGFWERPHDGGSVQNACIHVSSRGMVEAVYRKIHLFDVELSDGTVLKESQTVEPGTEPVVADTVAGPTGLSVCYDVRFPELYRHYAKVGAEVLVVPAAFTQTTGKDHWHVLLRARAIENQCFVLAAAQSGHHFGNRYSFGHALIVDPWGRILAECSETPSVVCVDLDKQVLRDIREQLPALKHRRL